MGRTLHNKIHLGRAPLLHSKRVQGALVLGACVSIALAWLAIRSFQ